MLINLKMVENPRTEVISNDYSEHFNFLDLEMAIV